jgi:hypothetical protein
MELLKSAISQLLDCVKFWEEGYGYCRFTVLAIRTDQEARIVTAQLAIRIAAPLEPPVVYETDLLVAGHFDFPVGISEAKRILSELQSGIVEIRDRKFRFPMGDSPGAIFEPLHPFGLADGRRLSTIRVYGISRASFFNRTRLDWHLKSAEMPMDGVTDVAASLGIPIPQGDSCQFEAVAVNVIEFEGNSFLKGTSADIRIIMLPALDKEKVRVGYKVMLQGKVLVRESKAGAELQWGVKGEMTTAALSLEVPAGAVVQAFASYNGGAQQQYWLLDPNALPNARRTAYAVIDKKLEALRETLLDNVDVKGKPARAFEDGVLILLHILGFSAISPGRIPSLSDGADCLVCSPSRDFAIIECTVGTPDNKDKLGKLFARAQKTRAALDQAGFQHLKLIPVIVSARGRAEIPATEFEKAQRLRIAVVCREELEQALQRSMFGEAAEQIYREAEDATTGSLQLELPNVEAASKAAPG